MRFQDINSNLCNMPMNGCDACHSCLLIYVCYVNIITLCLMRHVDEQCMKSINDMSCTCMFASSRIHVHEKQGNILCIISHNLKCGTSCMLYHEHGLLFQYIMYKHVHYDMIHAPFLSIGFLQHDHVLVHSQAQGVCIRAYLMGSCAHA